MCAHMLCLQGLESVAKCCTFSLLCTQTDATHTTPLTQNPLREGILINGALYHFKHQCDTCSLACNI